MFNWLTGTPSPAPEMSKESLENVRKSLKNGQQMYLENAVRRKMKNVSTTIEAFNRDDANGLLKLFDAYNEAVGSNAVNIPPEVRNTFLKFHQSVLAQISSDAPNRKDEIVKLLKAMADKDVEAKRVELETTANFTQYSPAAKDSVLSILKKIKDAQVKYKYFEFKYIEMNIFLMLFVQKVYQTMDDFIENVMTFNKIRDRSRNDLLNEMFNTITTMFSNIDSAIEPQHFEKLTQSFDTLKERMDVKDKEFEEKLKKHVVNMTNTNLSEFISGFTDNTKNKLLTALSKNTGRATSSASVSANTDNSKGTMTMPKENNANAYVGGKATKKRTSIKNTMTGGFPVGVPQALYKL